MLAAILEAAGVVIVVWAWVDGRRLAADLRRNQPYWGPVFSSSPSIEAKMPNRMRNQARRQEKRRDYELAQMQQEVVGILRGGWRELVGALCLVVGIIVGTIANFASLG